jgi:malonyl CoA-acyl carrier protein transacylase
MQDIASKDIAISVEFGPGGVLSGLAKRIDKNNQTIKFNTIDSFDKFNELVKKN